MARVRMLNGLKSNTDELIPLPFTHDGAPWPADVLQPTTFAELVDEHEHEHEPYSMLGTGWSSKTSVRFLAHALGPELD